MRAGGPIRVCIVVCLFCVRHAVGRIRVSALMFVGFESALLVVGFRLCHAGWRFCVCIAVYRSRVYLLVIHLPCLPNLRLPYWWSDWLLPY